MRIARTGCIICTCTCSLVSESKVSGCWTIGAEDITRSFGSSENPTPQGGERCVSVARRWIRESLHMGQKVPHHNSGKVHRPAHGRRVRVYCIKNEEEAVRWRTMARAVLSSDYMFKLRQFAICFAPNVPQRRIPTVS